jgi:hypothetical protein
VNKEMKGRRILGMIVVMAMLMTAILHFVNKEFYAALLYIYLGAE